MEVNSVIKKSIEAIAPPRKTKRKKPKLKIMTNEVLVAIKAKKSTYLEWKNNGKPHDPSNIHLMNKKLTTYELRKICRIEIAQRRINEREKLMEAKTMDKRLFIHY